MKKNNWFRWICYPIDIAAIAYLKLNGFCWFTSISIVLVPSFFNYLDGLYRGNNIFKH